MKYIHTLYINNKINDYKSLFDIDIDNVYGLEKFVENLEIEDYHDFYFMFKEKPLNEINSNTLNLIRSASYKFLTKTLNRNPELEKILKDDTALYIRYYGRVKDKFPDFVFGIDEKDILYSREHVYPSIQYDYIKIVKGKHDYKYNEFIFGWDITLIFSYLENIIEKPWKELEDHVLKYSNNTYLDRYLTFLEKYYTNQGISKDELQDELKNKHPNIIKKILERASDSKNPYGINFLISYIKSLSQKRWKEAEDIIFNEKNRDASSYIDYAAAIKEPIPEIEHYVSKYDKGSTIQIYFKKVVSPKFKNWEKFEQDGFEFISNLRQECINNGTILEFYRSLEKFIHSITTFKHLVILKIYKRFPDVINYLDDLIEVDDAIIFMKELLKPLESINNQDEWSGYSDDIRKIFERFIKNGNSLKNYGFKFLELIREKLDQIFNDNNKIKEIILDTFPSITKIIKDYTNNFNDFELEVFTFDILKSPWDVAEELILKHQLGAFGASYIQKMMNGQRWPEYEEVLLENGNAKDCYYYIIAVQVIIPEIEEVINRSPDYKMRYDKLKLRL